MTSLRRIVPVFIFLVLFMIFAACGHPEDKSSSANANALHGDELPDFSDSELIGKWELVAVEMEGQYLTPAGAKRYVMDEPLVIDVAEYDTFEEAYQIFEFLSDGTYILEYNKVVYESDKDEVTMADCVLYGTFNINMNVSPPEVIVLYNEGMESQIYQLDGNQLIFIESEFSADIFERVEQ